MKEGNQIISLICHTRSSVVSNVVIVTMCPYLQVLKLLIRLGEYGPDGGVIGRGHAARPHYDQHHAGHDDAAQHNQKVLRTHLVYSIHRTSDTLIYSLINFTPPSRHSGETEELVAKIKALFPVLITRCETLLLLLHLPITQLSFLSPLFPCSFNSSGGTATSTSFSCCRCCCSSMIITVRRHSSNNTTSTSTASVLYFLPRPSMMSFASTSSIYPAVVAARGMG